MERLGDLLLGEFRFPALGEQRGGHFRLHRVDGRVALLLDGDLIGLAQLALGDLVDGGEDSGFIGSVEVARVLGGALGEPDDRVDHRLETAMAGHDGFEHRILGKLLGLRFDHQHGVASARDDEIEDGVLHFLDGRIDLQRAIDMADAGGADWAHEGHSGQR